MAGKLLFLFGLLLTLAASAFAQDDAPSINTISYGQTVEDIITASAVFDWWQLEAAEGDQVSVEMAATGGLQPLVAVLNPSGDAVARSDDGAANATVRLNYTIPAAGQYTVVATRVGGPDGTSTGAYTLRLLPGNLAATEADPSRQVTFRCHEFEAAAAATIRFAEDARPELSHRITVYGMDGFKPVIRVRFSSKPDYDDCIVDAGSTAEDTFTLPGEAARTMTADMPEAVSQLRLGGAENMRLITLTIASRDGTPGRYVALIEGFSIEHGDRDAVDVSLGPLAKSTALTVYMVATPNSRLDPFMAVRGTEETCDDAGRTGCEAVVSFADAGFRLHDEGEVTITGDRNDAGLELSPGNTDVVTLELGSRQAETWGDYALVLIGELPPRE